MHSTFGTARGGHDVNAFFNRARCRGRRRKPPKHDIGTVRRPVRAEVDRPRNRGQAQRVFLSYLFDVDAGSTTDRHIRTGPGERDTVAIGRERRFVLAAGIGRQWDQPRLRLRCRHHLARDEQQYRGGRDHQASHGEHPRAYTVPWMRFAWLRSGRYSDCVWSEATVDWSNKAISSASECLNEDGRVRRFAQRIAQPLDGSIQAMIEIDEGVHRPEFACAIPLG